VCNKNPLLTKRIDLHIGYNCNARCDFCYYLDYLGKAKDLPVSSIYRKLRFIRSKGIVAVDITGGEPTLRKDILNIVEQTRSLGFKTICMISNGMKLSDANFVDNLIEAGVGEFLLTLEGNNAQLHDKMVKTEGAFSKLLRAVDIIKKTTANLRFNTVITGQNFTHLPQIAEVLGALRPNNVNLIHYNPILKSFPGLKEHQLRYSESSPFIKKALDVLGSKIEELYVRYVPFCFLKDYERFICNYYQIQYDKYEWDYLLRSRLQYGLLPHLLKLAVGSIGLKSHKRLKSLGWQEFKHEAIIKAKVSFSHRKSNACKNCRCDLICEGLWKEYVKIFGIEELNDLPGLKIDNPLYFRENN